MHWNTPEDRERDRRLYEQVLKELGPFTQLRVNNHWVPVTYLKEFTDSGTKVGKLWMYDREDPWNPKLVPPTAVAKQNRLYVLPEEVEQPADLSVEQPVDIVERLLDRFFEAPFAKARDWIVHGGRYGMNPVRPSAEKLAALCRFVAIQYTRTPAWKARAEWMASIHATFDAIVDLRSPRAVQKRHYGRTGERISRKEIQRMREELETGDLLLRPPDVQWLPVAVEGALKSAELIMRSSRWVRLCPKPGVELPTSDTPVVMTRRKPGGRYVLDGGWLNSLTIFPLAPGCAVVFRGRKAESGDFIPTHEWCPTARELIIRNAQRFVFARTPSDDISTILESSEPPRMVIEFGGEQYSIDEPVGPVVKKMMDSPHDLIRFGPPE